MTEEELLSVHLKVAQQDYENARMDAAERVRIQASLADRALQALLFANGGALIALFTFVGNAGAMSLDFGWLRLAFALFASGLFLGLLAHMLAFLSQDRFYNQAMQEIWRNQRDMVTGSRTVDRPLEISLNVQGQRFYLGGIIIAALSMSLFVGGCATALAAVAG